MPTKPPNFEKSEYSDFLYMWQKGSLRCTAIMLSDGSLCLYSPVAGLTSQTIESLSETGNVRFLLAPNHYHNKGISEYVDAFPEATLCASEAAIPRLENQTELSFESLDALTALLPGKTSIVQPHGLKTGEVWVGMKASRRSIWLVTDAFCGASSEKGGSVTEQPELLKTFPRYGVGDSEAYYKWVIAHIKRDNPRTVIPCHHSIIASDNLPQHLIELVTDNFA